MAVTINASIDNVAYENITKIVTGGKEINLSGVADGSDLPANIAEIKSGSWTQSAISGSDYTFAHGCAGTPDIVIIQSDFRTAYTSDNKPANTTIVAAYYNALGFKSYSAVPTSYTGSGNPTTNVAAAITNADDGQISTVDETNVVINCAANRQLGILTYTWFAIRLA